ncbi:MAG: hypothetical protein IJ620_02880 [Bacteroidales bacterium]|nr:hypothetical protein [Bacteroidales bacterium]
MSIIEYFNAHSPISNLPDLLNLHHSDPLGMGTVAMPVIIFVLTFVMAWVNNRIRRHGKSNLYNLLYGLLGATLVCVYYYCFQGNLPLHSFYDNVPAHPVIGWFCQHDLVGWGVAIPCLLAMTFVIYNLLTACMQTVAQLSVEAKLIEGKPWKEWKTAVYILLIGVLLIELSVFISYTLSTWMFVATQAALVIFVIYKIVADSRRCGSIKWGLLIGCTALVCIEACFMLSVECLSGAIFFIVILAAFLTQAKARKKKVDKAQ